MSVYDFYKRTTGNFQSQNGLDRQSLGQQLKAESDNLMDELFWTDPQSKICYIYDFFHDDQPSLKDHMTYSHTTKTRIDAKFIVKSYQSIDKDQVEYYLQFRPSQKMEFDQNDELYYFETEYRQRYSVEFPIGLYVDLPDDRGVYRKWLICAAEPANQFPKYLILPCNYQLMWVEKNKDQRIKRKMWGALRQQNSYNSGLWRDYDFQTQQNQQKCWLPLNPISEKIWYTTDDKKNMRVLLGAPIEKPVAWIISKVENAAPIGLQKLTLYQDMFDQTRDLIEKDPVTGRITGMYADYYDSPIEPSEPPRIDIPAVKSYGKIVVTNAKIKVGSPSYKTLTAEIFDESNTVITEKYTDVTFTWTCFVSDEDMTDKVTWLKNTSAYNQIKVKFPADKTYLTKILTVKCTVTTNTETIEATADLELY